MKNIKRKIMLIVSASILIIEAIIISFSNVNSISTTKNAVISTSDLLTQNISKLVAEQVSAYQTLASEIGCADIICSKTATAAQKMEYLNKKVQQYGFERGDIIGADGFSITNGNDYYDRAWYKTTQSGKVAVSEPLIGKSTGKLANIIAAPIWQNGEANSTVIGAVYLVPPATYLDDIIKNISISDNTKIYIADKNGVIIGSTTEGVVETFVTYSDYTTDEGAKSAIKQIEAQMAQGVATTIEFNLDGRRTLGISYPLNNYNGWNVCVLLDTGDFMGNAYVMIFVSIGIGIVFLAVALFFSFTVTNKISGNIRKCTARIIMLSEGDLHSPVPTVNSSDETKILEQSMETLTYRLNSIISDMSAALGAMADGDFSVESEGAEKFVGDFEQLYTSCEKIPSSISTVLSKIHDSAEQVTGSSEQVASSSQALSQGATEQASAIQELAATISEIAENTKNNSEHAVLANKSVNEVGSAILDSN